MSLLQVGGWLQSPSTANDHKMLVIKGGAGTGKTQFIKSIHTYLDTYEGGVIVLAPTNKAAKVLRLRGIPANTIHRITFNVVPTGRTKQILTPLLDPTTFIPQRDADNKIIYKSETEDICEYVFDEESIFEKVQDLRLAITSPNRAAFPLILIIDESSMVPAELWYNLLNTEYCRIIAVGDPNQLPPIEDLDRMPSDLAQRYAPYVGLFKKRTASITLTTNHRQSNGSNILTVMDSILKNGAYPVPFTTSDVTVYDLRFHKTPIQDYRGLAAADMIVTHTNKMVDKVNAIVRANRHEQAFQEIDAADRVLPLRGDVLYVTKTLRSQKRIVLSKGDMLTIISDPIIDADNDVAIIDVEVDDGTQQRGLTLNLDFVGRSRKPRALTAFSAGYGYALTTHRAQGSQFPNVIIIDEQLPYNRKEWLYTAVSRASATLTILRGA